MQVWGFLVQKDPLFYIRCVYMMCMYCICGGQRTRWGAGLGLTLFEMSGGPKMCSGHLIRFPWQAFYKTTQPSPYSILLVLFLRLFIYLFIF